MNCDDAAKAIPEWCAPLANEPSGQILRGAFLMDSLKNLRVPVLLLADLNRGILRSFVGSNWNNGWVAELYALLHFIYLIAIPLPL